MYRLELGDCMELLKGVTSESVDLVVTSPPYAEQRIDTYGGIRSEDYPEYMLSIGREIYRVLKPSGSFVLNIKEHVSNGARDPYALKTVLALSELFLWNDTYIWNKTNPFPTGNSKRLKDGFEYCYLFVKSPEYKFNPNNVLVESTSKWLESEQRRNNKGEHNTTNGSGMNMSVRYSAEMVRPSNVLSLPIDSTNHEHPATFPLGLPRFFIDLLTDPEDMVLDPFMGSGTTGVASVCEGRNFIGFEIVPKYFDIAKREIDQVDVPALFRA